MSDSKPRASGRTAEQKAAREARKAAKAAAMTIDATPQTAGGPNVENAGPSGSQSSEAIVVSSDPAPAKVPKGVNSEDYEIDLNAAEPLSKAELRAARKRAKLGLPAVDAGEKGKKKRKLGEYNPLEDEAELLRSKTAGGGEGGLDKRKREGEAREKIKPVKQNSIWIGNMAFKTTPAALKEWVEKGIVGLGGAEGSVTRVNMPKKPGKGTFGESKGFAYVDLATPELQKLAVGLSEGMLEGRKLLIKLGDDHTASDAARTPKPAQSTSSNPILRNQKHAESATLFVGNLPFDATEEGLRDLVEGNAHAGEAAEAVEAAEESFDEGKETKQMSAEKEQQQVNRGGKRSGLRKVRLGAFEDTGRCKGFAFLDFLEPKLATKALINKKNHFYNGRKIMLQYASEDATKRSGGSLARAARPTGDKSTRGGKSGKAKYNSGSQSHSKTGETRNDSVADAVVDTQPAPAAWSREHPRGSGKDREDVRGKKWQAAGRPRPGAALAMAKREKVGIVEAQGQKISFD